MGETVNLNRLRKLRDRAKKRAQADENALKFGRTKTQRQAEEAAEARARTVLDAHKRDRE